MTGPVESLLPLAHALGARADLPIEPWVAAWGASLVLIVSFFALGAGWRRSRFEVDDWRPFGGGLSRVAASLPAQALYGLIGVLLLGLAIYAGLDGTEAADRNFALTFIFVTSFLGFPLAGVLFGDLFRAFNPWRAIGRLSGWAFGKTVRQEPVHLAYPHRLGRWPAAVGLLAFVWLEVIYGPGGQVSVALSPYIAAEAAIFYSVFTLAMMALFGTETWCRNGETFGVYFGMFSQLGWIEARDGRLGRRRPLSGASKWASVPGSLALVVASIATTSFDGAQEGVLEGAITGVSGFFGDAGLGQIASLRLSDSIFLLLSAAAIALVYLLGVRGMRTVGKPLRATDLSQGFAHTLIPIAFAYIVAHYFSLFVFQEQAQFTFLLSDPLGNGTANIFGTADSGIDYTVIGANAIQFVQIGALLIGHALGLTLAHDRAIATWGDPQVATRSQYWMLAVMVAFTCLGIYLLTAGNE